MYIYLISLNRVEASLWWERGYLGHLWRAFTLSSSSIKFQIKRLLFIYFSPMPLCRFLLVIWFGSFWFIKKQNSLFWRQKERRCGLTTTTVLLVSHLTYGLISFTSNGKTSLFDSFVHSYDLEWVHLMNACFPCCKRLNHLSYLVSCL